MTIELHAFSSSASGVPAAGQFGPSTTCTLTFHRAVDGTGAQRSMLSWSASASPSHAADSQAQSASASTLRRRSLTITYR